MLGYAMLEMVVVTLAQANTDLKKNHRIASPVYHHVFLSILWPYTHILLACIGGYCYNFSKPKQVSLPESLLFFQTTMVISRLRSTLDLTVGGL